MTIAVEKPVGSDGYKFGETDNTLRDTLLGSIPGPDDNRFSSHHVRRTRHGTAPTWCAQCVLLARTSRGGIEEN